MTIIHTYNNRVRAKYNFSFSRSYRNLFVLPKTLLLEGAVKTTLLLSILVISILGLWLYIFCAKLSLDYQVSVLKTEIRKEEEAINSLHESLASNISDEKIMAWAKANNFVPINSIKYLKIDTPNLAQANLSTIK
jgi:cell division protein FtsL